MYIVHIYIYTIYILICLLCVYEVSSHMYIDWHYIVATHTFWYIPYTYNIYMACIKTVYGIFINDIYIYTYTIYENDCLALIMSIYIYIHVCIMSSCD